MIPTKKPGFTQRRALELSHKSANDWCHLCGNRDPVLPLADCWYPDPSHDGGAEGNPDGPRDFYIRICADCGELIQRVASKVPPPSSIDAKIEHRYRMGVHQAYAMLSSWLDDHRNADPWMAIEVLTDLARRARTDTPPEGRQPGDFLVDRLLEEMEGRLQVREPEDELSRLRKLRNLLLSAAEAAEKGWERHPLMEDVHPRIEVDRDGSRVGHFIYNMIRNVLDAMEKDEKDET